MRPIDYNHTFAMHSYGRSVSDEGSQEIEPAQIATWKAAIERLGTRKLQLPTCVASIEADWTPVLRKHQRHYSVMKLIDSTVKKHKDPTSALEQFPNGKTKIRISTKILSEASAERGSAHAAANAIEAYLHDIFLILNICSPGSCDFYRATLFTDKLHRDVSLSNFVFEMALLGSNNSEWPNVESLALNQTIEWFDSVRVGVGQIPQNPMEKVLFALLHVSKLEMSPIMPIWLFYAFESLLQTRAGENFNSIVNRLSLLLELNEAKSSLLRRKLRDLYNIRSAIVHGGFEVNHPMHNEILDQRVDANYQKLSDATDYGLTVLIAAIQNTIRRGWKFPKFLETVGGVDIAPAQT